ncbi:MAG TPA: imidazolonepropionase, partial [Actinoplanes sp.]|nr:imidazolonepropionase [Actinoplanes sp.]
MSLLIDHIGELVTNDPTVDGTPLGIVRNAAVLVDGDRIAWVGSATATPAADERFDVDGAAVLPGFVDSHAHLVFAGDRAAEFEARMAGAPYTGGGI